MKKISPIAARVAIITGLAVGAFAVAALADWTQPVSGPPVCATGNPGCDAPLNVGYGPQTKQGGIILNGYSAGTTVMQYGLWVVNGAIWAQGGLIIPTCTVASNNCPDSNNATPANGSIWLAQ